MTLRDLSYLAIKILSIYILFLGINHLGTLLNNTIPALLHIENNTKFLEILLFVLIPAGFQIICGLVLWFMAYRISSIMLPKNSNGNELSVQLRDMEGFVLSAVGLILVILSFTVIVKMSMNYIYLLDQDFRFNRREMIYTFIEQLIRFVIGIVLLFKAKGIALALRRIRELGMKQLNHKDGNS